MSNENTHLIFSFIKNIQKKLQTFFFLNVVIYEKLQWLRLTSDIRLNVRKMIVQLDIYNILFSVRVFDVSKALQLLNYLNFNTITKLEYSINNFSTI